MSRKMTRHRVFVVVALGLAALVGFGLVGCATASDSVATDPHGMTLPAQRQVQLSLTMPSPSNSDGLHAQLVAGAMPATAIQATVVSDAECQPDARGISHCLNRLQLADGSDIQVRHPHDMTKVPCLSPGEQVRIVPPLNS